MERRKVRSLTKRNNTLQINSIRNRKEEDVRRKVRNCVVHCEELRKREELSGKK